MNNTLTIEQPDIVAFTMAIQQAILDGYRLSEVSDYAPQNIGFVYVTTMFKAPNPVLESSTDNLEVVLTLNTEQVVEQLNELADKVGEVDSDKALEIVEKAITVEAKDTQQSTKQTQRRNTRGGKQ